MLADQMVPCDYVGFDSSISSVQNGPFRDDFTALAKLCMCIPKSRVGSDAKALISGSTPVLKTVNALQNFVNKRSGR